MEINNLTEDNIKNLQSYAATQILPKLRINVPSEMKWETQELMSEIWNSYHYLVKKYKDGTCPVTHWCSRYAYQITLDNIWKEYRIQKSFTSIDKLEKEPTYMNNKTQENITSTTTIEENEDKVELNDRIKEVLKKMSLPDLEIAKMYLHGLTLERIGEIVGMSKGNVLKRLQKYAK